MPPQPKKNSPNARPERLGMIDDLVIELLKLPK